MTENYFNSKKLNIFLSIVFPFCFFILSPVKSAQYSPQSCPVLCDPWSVACQAFLSITNSRSLLKLMSIDLVMPSNHLILILCHPLLLQPSVFPSIRVFSNELVLHIRWPKYWSFSLGIISSNEYSGLISTRIDRLDLLAVQGTLKSLLQHHRPKASILWRSAFFRVQLSHPYVTAGKTTASTIPVEQKHEKTQEGVRHARGPEVTRLCC